MKYSIYLFDFDYTLVDSSQGIIKCINYALDKMNYSKCQDYLIEKLIGESLEKIFFEITKEGEFIKFQKFRDYFMEYSLKHMHDNVTVYSDTINTLRELKSKNRQIGILSAKDNFTIKKISKRLGFFEYIDLILGEDDVENQKPAADQINLSLKLLEKSPKDAIYVGDSIVDAMAAVNANVDFCAITRGKTTAEQFRQFQHIGLIDNLSDILLY